MTWRAFLVNTALAAIFGMLTSYTTTWVTGSQLSLRGRLVWLVAGLVCGWLFTAVILWRRRRRRRRMLARLGRPIAINAAAADVVPLGTLMAGPPAGWPACTATWVNDPNGVDGVRCVLYEGHDGQHSGGIGPSAVRWTP